MMTVNSANACRLPAMPQEHRRRSCDEYDVISSDFPPPSLKPANSPDQDKRKKKKWSIGGLFRRKKKVSDTDSSSPLEEDEEKKGFLERRRARKRRNRGSKDVTGSFEAVIINHRQSQVLDNNTELRDVSSDRVGRSHESLTRRETNHIRGSSVSLEGAGKKGGRLQIKARVEESRERLRGDSSSDEGGGSSKHSSSSIRLRGDETLSKDGSLSRRSRAARTERYKKRLSKDDEALREFRVPSRISRSDERLSNKKAEKSSGTNKWTAKVVYYESSDYDTKYTAITKSATPSPIQSPKARPKNALHYTASAPPVSNYVTYPPSHAREGVVGSHQELRSQNYPLERIPPNQRHPNNTPPKLPKSNSDMIAKSAQLPNSIQRHYPSWGQEALNRKSASYDCNVNNIHYVNKQISRPHPADENVLVVQFPISRPTHKVENKVKMGLHSLQHGGKQHPPPPPPRDPHRRLIPSNGYHESSPRPMSYAFEDRSPVQPNFPGYPDFGSSTSAFQRVPQTHPVPIDLEQVVSINRHQRSSSDNHIPSRTGVKQSPPTSRKIVGSEQLQRYYQNSLDIYTSSPPSDGLQPVPCHYQYYTDQQPRSRKPIHITCQNQKPQSDPYLSDSQVIIKPPLQQTPRARPPGVQNAADFWKQKDQESAKKVHISEGSPKLIQRHLLNISQGHERSVSPLKEVTVGSIASKLKLPPLLIPTKGVECSNSLNSTKLNSPTDNHTPRTPNGKIAVHNEIGIPIFDCMDLNSNTKRPLSLLDEKQETYEQEPSPSKEKLQNPPTPPKRKDSKVNAVTSFENFDIFDSEKKDGRRKSSNLEEALNELEAIYKSLRLGEETYLEKVAKEKETYEFNRLDPTNWNAWVQSRGFESDSSFNYSRSSLESVDSVDSPVRNTNSKRPGIPDRVTDDMAYRRLNKKDRLPPQEQEVISQAGSFLLVSPTLSPPPFIEPPPVAQMSKEPDVEKDDVVYRSIKHVNNTLKCLDPQPPFGIPLGPITPAPNSDYLHISPKEAYRPSFKPRKIPDVVTDDLAFRNLRKDSNKEPLFTGEEVTILDSPTMKKKRAVRSLSANLLSIIQRESVAMKNSTNKLMYNNNGIQGEIEKSQSFTDVNEALNGQSTNGNFVQEHLKLRDIHSKKNISSEDSDVTPRVSRVFSIGTSSPLTATSTETLTGSKNSLLTPESKPINSLLSKTPSPRLSLTPERRHTTDNVSLYPQKSRSPSISNSMKSDSFKNLFTASYPKSDFHRSPTPESYTLTQQSKRIREDTPPAYNQNESDLLAILAKEAKEASELLSKELNDLKFENKFHPIKTSLINSSSIQKEQIEKKVSTGSLDTQTKNSSIKSSIGKVVPHKPVKLNTFVITEDNKLQSKQSEIKDKPIDFEESKSMTDLLKELTRSLDADFGNSQKDFGNQANLNGIKEEISEEDEEKHKTIETKNEGIFFDDTELNTTDFKECEDKYFSSHEDVSDERFSSPEKFLQSFVAEVTEKRKEQMEQKGTQLTVLPIDIPINEVDDHEKTDKIVCSEEAVVPSNENDGGKSSIRKEEAKKSNEDQILLIPTIMTSVEYESLNDSSNQPLSDTMEQDAIEVEEVLNALNEESSKQNEQLTPASSPLPKRFPLELPKDEITVDEQSSKPKVSSHSPDEAEISDLLGCARTTETSSPGPSKESRVVAARPRDCIDCPRMTDEGKTCLKGCVAEWTLCVHERP